MQARENALKALEKALDFHIGANPRCVEKRPGKRGEPDGRQKRVKPNRLATPIKRGAGMIADFANIPEPSNGQL